MFIQIAAGSGLRVINITLAAMLLALAASNRAVKCLVKDRADLLAFYDFPAEHWKHIRTTNPMIRTFATVRHRTARAMTHRLMLSARKKRCKLDGQNRLPEIIKGVEFRVGINPESKAA